MLGSAGDVPGETKARAEVVLVIARQCSGVRAADGLHIKIGPIICVLVVAEQVGIDIPAHAQVESEAPADFPIVVDIDTQHFRAANLKVRIPGRARDGLDRARRGEALRVFHLVVEDDAGNVDKRRRHAAVRHEESAQLGLIHEIDSSLKGMPAEGDGKIVAELPLGLIRLLRHVGILSERDAAREGWIETRGGSVDQVVPILIARREGVDYVRPQYGVERQVGQDQFVDGRVPGREILGGRDLVVITLIALPAVAGEEIVALIEAMIEAAVVTPIEIGRGIGRLRLRAQKLNQAQFAKGGGIGHDAGLLALAFQGEK